jgi:hypothetical protein
VRSRIGTLFVCITCCCAAKAQTEFNPFGKALPFWLDASREKYNQVGASSDKKTSQPRSFYKVEDKLGGKGAVVSINGSGLAMNVATELIGDGVVNPKLEDDVTRRIEDFTSFGHKKYNRNGAAESQNFVVMVVKLVKAMADYVTDDSQSAKSIKALCSNKLKRSGQWWRTEKSVGGHDPIADCKLYMRNFNLKEYIDEIHGALRYFANPKREPNDLDSVRPEIDAPIFTTSFSSAFQALARIPNCMEDTLVALRDPGVDVPDVGEALDWRLMMSSFLTMSQLKYGKTDVAKANLMESIVRYYDGAALSAACSPFNAIQLLSNHMLLTRNRCSVLRSAVNGSGMLSGDDVRLMRNKVVPMEIGCGTVILHLNGVRDIGYLEESKPPYRLGTNPLIEMPGLFEVPGYQHADNRCGVNRTPESAINGALSCIQGLQEKGLIETRFQWSESEKKWVRWASTSGRCAGSYELDTVFMRSGGDGSSSAGWSTIHIPRLEGGKPYIRGYINLRKNKESAELFDLMEDCIAVLMYRRL